jgi:hypothetical protein
MVFPFRVYTIDNQHLLEGIRALGLPFLVEKMEEKSQEPSNRA